MFSLPESWKDRRVWVPRLGSIVFGALSLLFAFLAFQHDFRWVHIVSHTAIAFTLWSSWQGTLDFVVSQARSTEPWVHRSERSDTRSHSDVMCVGAVSRRADGVADRLCSPLSYWSFWRGTCLP